ncbi:MAG: hypothetical protein ACR2PS_10335 [Pseudomonadales bacterium]
MWKDRADGLNNVLTRYERFYDTAIAKRWIKLAEQTRRETILTRDSLSLVIHRSATRNKVNYSCYVIGHGPPVASMACCAPRAGRVQLSKAQVHTVGGVDFRRNGIGSAIYDLIERDVVAAGAQGIEPHWSTMTEDAIAFWAARRPEYSE